MTLLDGDGPFNYSTLMQSAVNTLNQAAEEEAAYPSSLPSSLSFFPSLALSPYPLFSYPWSPSHLLGMVFLIHPVFACPPLSESCLCILYVDTPECLSLNLSKLC